MEVEAIYYYLFYLSYQFNIPKIDIWNDIFNPIENHYLSFRSFEISSIFNPLFISAK